MLVVRFIDTNIINQHCRRIGRGRVGKSREASAANGEIHQDKKWRIENPLTIDARSGGSHGEERSRKIVAVKLHVVRRPTNPLNLITPTFALPTILQFVLSPTPL